VVCLSVLRGASPDLLLPLAAHPLSAAAALHLAPPHTQQKKLLRKAPQTSRLRLLRFQLTEKRDSQLYELWPGHGDLAASALEIDETMDVCMRHIEARGEDRRVWKRLRTFLRKGVLYDFEHWHWYFFDEKRVSDALKPLVAEVTALVRPQLPAPAKFGRNS